MSDRLASIEANHNRNELINSGDGEKCSHLQPYDYFEKKLHIHRDPKADESLPNLVFEHKAEECNLKFHTVLLGRMEVIVSVTLPDCEKLTRRTEPVEGRDGKSGYRVLKGYELSDGTLIEKDIHKNTDGSISVLDLDNDNRHPDRHEQRMSEAEFIAWVNEQKTSILNAPKKPE